jgi:Zn-dependent protease
MTFAAADGTAGTPVLCPDCGSGIGRAMLACPGCHRLVHADALAELKARAETAGSSGDYSAELLAWREAAALLPTNSRQYAAVTSRIDTMTRAGAAAGSAPAALPTRGPWKWLAGLGAAGIFLFKFKFLIVALLTKGKFLVLGLTKVSTFGSMLLAFGVYWTAWGMWFAAGLVLSIYVHEMGHVAAIRRYGLAASAPMFVPGFGAFIRLGAGRLAPHEDARIGLAGPTWGLAAAVAALSAGYLGAGPMYLAIAHTGAWLNLFNLLPVWQLDGNRGFAALSRMQRWSVAAIFACAWGLAGDGLFALLAIAAGGRALQRDAAEMPDQGVVLQFALLIGALTLVFVAAA